MVKSAVVIPFMSIFTDETMQLLHDRVHAEVRPIEPIIAKEPREYLAELVEAILGQQLSTLAADKIIARVKENVGGAFTIDSVLGTPPERFRELGTSNAKASYIRNIAQAFKDKHFDYEQFPKFSDEQIITALSQIKGVGRWTVEMFLIFTMGRPDVFSLGDLALRRAVTRHYGYKAEPKGETILRHSRKWAPNRSLASRVLWRSLELKDSLIKN
jgi:DNA-3-methyladenine glycosylase II